jgi:hypothetical protein
VVNEDQIFGKTSHTFANEGAVTTSECCRWSEARASAGFRRVQPFFEQRIGKFSRFFKAVKFREVKLLKHDHLCGGQGTAGAASMNDLATLCKSRCITCFSH